MKTPMLFAELLRDKRRAAGLTQEELANKCGLSMNTLHGYERGVAPTIGNLQRIAAALNVNLSELLACEFPPDGRCKSALSAGR